LTGGPPKPLAHFLSDEIFHFDWSRDAGLLLSRGTEPTDAVPRENFRLLRDTFATPPHAGAILGMRPDRQRSASPRSRHA
jgi:hypothetical protein